MTDVFFIPRSLRSHRIHRPLSDQLFHLYPFSVFSRLRFFLPELAIATLFCFFALRELGTFPAAWADEGLFLIVAKMLAAGNGYALPLLDQTWYYPYFLNVGPTLIVPAAVSIKLFGLSIAAARLPMVLWLSLTTWLTYALTNRYFGRTEARWAALLLVTLSAFINTGKPVLGEIPAVAFTLLGLLALDFPRGWKRTTGAGVAFGLAFLTKLTFGLLLPALGVAWLIACIRRDWKEARDLTCVGILTIVVYLPWRITEELHTAAGGFFAEIYNFIFVGGGETAVLRVFTEQPQLLLRLPYLAFDVFLILGLIGLWRHRARISLTTTVTITTLVLLFTLYCFNGFGWYRLLLPAHLLLLPFVPAGAFGLGAPRKLVILGLSTICVAQFWWQVTHRGSNPGTEGQVAADFVMREFQDKDLLVEQAEVFARLPVNPHWKFVIPNLSFSLPQEYGTVAGELCGIPLLRKMPKEEIAEFAASGATLTLVADRFFLIEPPYPCPHVNE